MEYGIKKINACERELEVTVSEDEARNFFNAAYNKVAPRVDIKGFRKGKVPRNMIMKFYGQQIESEADLDTANHYLQQITKENNIKILSQPALEDVVKENGKTTFKLRFEANPEFELGDYRSIAIEEPIHRVSDDEVNEHLDKILEMNGTKEDVDTVETLASEVKVEYTLKPAEGDEASQEKPTKFDLNLKDERYPSELLEKFIDKKAGDEIEYTHPNGAVSIYKIISIQKIVPLTAHEDAIKMLSQNKFDNVDDFKQELGFQIQEKWDEKAREIIEENIIESLVNMHEFEVPSQFYKDNLIKYSIDFYKQQKVKLTEKDIVEELPMFDKYFGDTVKKGIQWNFISEKIIEKEKIEIEESDIEEHIENISKMFPGVPLDNLSHLIKTNDEFKSHILIKKLMDLLLDFCTTNEIDFDEYMQKQHQKNEMERLEKFNQVQAEIDETTGKVIGREDTPKEEVAEEAKSEEVEEEKPVKKATRKKATTDEKSEEKPAKKTTRKKADTDEKSEEKPAKKTTKKTESK